MKNNQKNKNTTSSVSPAVRIGALILAGLMLLGTAATIVYALLGI